MDSFFEDFFSLFRDSFFFLVSVCFIAVPLYRQLRFFGSALGSMGLTPPPFKFFLDFTPLPLSAYFLAFSFVHPFSVPRC